MSDRVRVLARFRMKPDHVDDFIQVARDQLLKPTREEAGCIQYDLWQDTADPTLFSMVETWESAEALQTHLGQPALQQALGKLAPWAAEPPTVQRLRSIED